jgi:hypothetical protein
MLARQCVEIDVCKRRREILSVFLDYCRRKLKQFGHPQIYLVLFVLIGGMRGFGMPVVS